MSSGYDDLADDAWLGDVDDVDDEADGDFMDGWTAGSNAARCTCPGVTHPPTCGSWQPPPSWGSRLWHVLRGGAR